MVFPTQYMMQPMFTTQSTKFNMHHVLLEKDIGILNFQPSGQPVYAFISSTEHCYWDLDCPSKYCVKCRHRHSSYNDEEDDRPRKKKSSSQKSLQKRYENGDPKVDLLGESSGKFDYYVLYPKRTSQSRKPFLIEPSKPETPHSPPKPKPIPPKSCKEDVRIPPPLVQLLPQICMMQPTSNPSSYQTQYPALREFHPMSEYTQNQYRYMPRVPNPTDVDASGQQKKTSTVEDVLNWQT